MLSAGDTCTRELDGLEFECIVLRKNSKTFVDSYDLIYVDDSNIETGVLAKEISKRESEQKEVSIKLLELGLSKLDPEEAVNDTEVVGAEVGTWDHEYKLLKLL